MSILLEIDVCEPIFYIFGLLFLSFFNSSFKMAGVAI